MSEEIKTLPEITVERNGVTVTFVTATKKRGNNPGELFYAYPQTIDLQKLIQHFGEEETKGILLARGNLYAQRWMQEASLNEDETPKPFDAEEFKKYATEFSARGLTAAGLAEEISKRTDELNEYVMSEEFLSLATTEERKAALAPKVEKIKSLKAALAARKRKKDDNSDE